MKKQVVVEATKPKIIEAQDFDLIVDDSHAPILMWTKGLPVEEGAIRQLTNVAKMPFIHKHVAVMSDVHVGIGATIGSVIPTKGAIIPAAVGVDIGCGCLATRTNLKAKDLPDNLHALRSVIEAAIPHGRTHNGGPEDRGAWRNVPELHAQQWDSLRDGYNRIVDKHPKAAGYNTYSHLGTLGTGNHFIELVVSEDDAVWLLLHSGSRGVGNRIGTYFIEQAKREMERYYITDSLPDADLSYLVEHTTLYDDYVEAVEWAQNFATVNRQLMMREALHVLFNFLKWPVPLVEEQVVSCHHNYIAKENHYGANVIVTRKGAVRAREGEYGIIPGAMGKKTYIVKGKGNKESFCSCSHGAGRTMSRGQAKKTISLEQHAHDVQGVECRLDANVLDESPRAYKDIDAVIKAQESLITVVHTLTPLLNIKG